MTELGAQGVLEMRSVGSAISLAILLRVRSAGSTRVLSTCSRYRVLSARRHALALETLSELWFPDPC